MAGSDAASTNVTLHATKFAASAAGAIIPAVVPAVFSAVLGLLLLAAPAQAQYGPPPWAYQYYHGDYPPPPGPPGDEGPLAAPPGYFAPALTVADIRRRVARLGLHLVAKPRRRDNIYLAEAEDPNGVAYRLVFDAQAGRLIQNTKLPPLKKKIAATPPATAAGQ
jgi:hypothetical protein